MEECSNTSNVNLQIEESISVGYPFEKLRRPDDKDGRNLLLGGVCEIKDQGCDSCSVGKEQQEWPSAVGCLVCDQMHGRRGFSLWIILH